MMRLAENSITRMEACNDGCRSKGDEQEEAAANPLNGRHDRCSSCCCVLCCFFKCLLGWRMDTTRCRDIRRRWYGISTDSGRKVVPPVLELIALKSVQAAMLLLLLLSLDE